MIDFGTKLPENRIHLFDPVGQINDGYGSYRAANYGIQARRTAVSYDSSTNTGGGLRFTVESAVEDESNSSSPRLWETSPPSTAKGASSPLHSQTMSPSSRTEAIARSRKELMEMVRDMPDSFYELSLKDIVDKKSALDVQHENMAAEEEKIGNEVGSPKERQQRKWSEQMKKSESKAKMTRSGSIDNGGFLLKTSVFPVSLRSKKNKKSLATVASFKIPPQPSPTPNGSVKGAEKEWWKRRSCISSESESSGLGSNSGSTRSSGSSSSSSSSCRRRYRARFLPSCCSFNMKRIQAKK
ncbi:hypothetical protein Nepgr_002737 [Nepenthes gracilis]|uniref:Uncharacterized protein n=1 Tax=Nepenthes gracilis TaxID=150966 RepID=A0AAD3P7J1_NEPGR|nr:hypothetical protein Nepgr_002737 [Nepenthes gracilis]